MLKVRVIPTLLWKNYSLVKGKAFNSARRVGSLLPAVKIYNARDVDELVVLDIAATTEGKKPNYDWVSDFADYCFLPLTVGGGISTVEHVSELLRVGADKVLINTAAYLYPETIEKLASIFGSQCLVAGIDAKLNSYKKYTCFSHAGYKNTCRDPVSWAKELADRGVGEIMITSIDHDGLMQGYDLNLTEMVVRAVDIPVIASGGAGTYTHLIDAVLKTGVSAVAAASMFHFTEQIPLGAKQALLEAGIPVRMNINMEI